VRKQHTKFVNKHGLFVEKKKKSRQLDENSIYRMIAISCDRYEELFASHAWWSLVHANHIDEVLKVVPKTWKM
jgi:hypothetical protein